MHRVVITGMGAITPFGVSVNALRNGLNEGKSALKYDEALKFVVGAIPGEPVENLWTAGQQREMSRASMFALVAAKEALTQSKAVEMNHEDTSVNIGTCMSDLLHIGETVQKVADNQMRKVSPYFVPRILNNLPAGYVAMKYKMRGGVEATSTACATGLHCIGNAFHAIRYGHSRRALAGAVECALNPISLAGFDRMRALAKGKEPEISRPFDKKRAGFVLSEGAGLVFLERLEDALERSANILAEVVGYGISSDCFHISTPDPSGIGAMLSMKRAISDAHGLSEQDICYINAHATSTPNGDTIEALAIRKMFPGRKMAVSSIKGHIGHLLGAAGSVEAIATVCAMNDGVLHANRNLEETEEDDDLHLLRKNEEWPKCEGAKISMCNSFGFGATNASLILKQF